MDRTKLTFSQAEGVVPIPTQLKPKELPRPLRNALWNAIYASYSECHHFDQSYGSSYLSEPWVELCYIWHTDWQHKPADEFDASPIFWREELKSIFFSKPYYEVFDFLQYLLRSTKKPRDIEISISETLKKHGAAYSIVGDTPTIMPVSSPEETTAVETALRDLRGDEFSGARVHMTGSASNLTQGDYANAVREAISAVESVCKVLGEKPGGDLESALTALSKRTQINPALKAGLSKLYAYTSSEKGIRHALLDDEAKVDSTDAQFMFGACASFISYLIQKSRQA